MLTESQCRALLNLSRDGSPSPFKSQLDALDIDGFIEFAQWFHNACLISTNSNQFSLKERLLTDLAANRLKEVLSTLFSPVNPVIQNQVRALMALPGVLGYGDSTQSAGQESLPIINLIKLIYVRDGFKNLMLKVMDRERLFTALLENKTCWPALPYVCRQFVEVCGRTVTYDALATSVASRLILLESDSTAFMAIVRQFMGDPDCFPLSMVIRHQLTTTAQATITCDDDVAKFVSAKMVAWKSASKDGVVLSDRDVRLAMCFLFDYLPSRVSIQVSNDKLGQLDAEISGLLSIPEIVAQLKIRPKANGLAQAYRSLALVTHCLANMTLPTPDATDVMNGTDGLPRCRHRVDIEIARAGDEESSWRRLSDAQQKMLTTAAQRYQCGDFGWFGDRTDNIFTSQGKINTRYDSDPIYRHIRRKIEKAYAEAPATVIFNQREYKLPLSWKDFQALKDQEHFNDEQVKLCNHTYHGHSIHGAARLLIYSYWNAQGHDHPINHWLLPTARFALWWHTSEGRRGCADITDYKFHYALTALASLDTDPLSFLGSIYHNFEESEYQAARDNAGHEACEQHDKALEEVQDDRRLPLKNHFTDQHLLHELREKAYKRMADQRFLGFCDCALGAIRSHNRDGDRNRSQEQDDFSQGDNPTCHLGGEQHSVEWLRHNAICNPPELLDINHLFFWNMRRPLEQKLLQSLQAEIGEDNEVGAAYYKAVYQCELGQAKQYNISDQGISSIISVAVNEQVTHSRLTEADKTRLTKKAKEYVGDILGDCHLVGLANIFVNFRQDLENSYSYQQAVRDDKSLPQSSVVGSLQQVEELLQSEVHPDSSLTDSAKRLLKFDFAIARQEISAIVYGREGDASGKLSRLSNLYLQQRGARLGTAFDFDNVTPLSTFWRCRVAPVFLPPELVTIPGPDRPLAVPGESIPMPVEMLLAVIKRYTDQEGDGLNDQQCADLRQFLSDLPTNDQRQLLAAIAMCEDTQGYRAIYACMSDQVDVDGKLIECREDLRQAFVDSRVLAKGGPYSMYWFSHHVLTQISPCQVLPVLLAGKAVISDARLVELISIWHDQWTTTEKCAFFTLVLDHPSLLARILQIPQGDQLLAAGLQSPRYDLSKALANILTGVKFYLDNQYYASTDKYTYPVSIFSYPQAAAVIFKRPCALAEAAVLAETSPEVLANALHCPEYHAFDDPGFSQVLAAVLETGLSFSDEHVKQMFEYSQQQHSKFRAIARWLAGGASAKLIRFLSLNGSDDPDQTLQSLVEGIRNSSMPPLLKESARVCLYLVLMDCDCLTRSYLFSLADAELTPKKHRLAIELMSDLSLQGTIRLLWSMRRTRQFAVFVYHLLMQRPSSTTPLFVPVIILALLSLLVYQLVTAALYTPSAILGWWAIIVQVMFIITIKPIGLAIYHCCIPASNTLIHETVSSRTEEEQEILSKTWRFLTGSSTAVLSAGFALPIALPFVWLPLVKLLAYALPLALLGTSTAVSFGLIPLFVAMAALLLHMLSYMVMVDLSPSTSPGERAATVDADASNSSLLNCFGWLSQRQDLNVPVDNDDPLTVSDPTDAEVCGCCFF